MINLKKDSNEKYIKFLNKGNNFYLTDNEVITNIYYGEKEIYKLSPQVDDENKSSTTNIPNNSILYDSIYPVDVERYIFKTGKLDLIDIDSPKFDITTALWIYLCWCELLIRYNFEFEEDFITEEDKANGIDKEKRLFFDFCFSSSSQEFFIMARYNLNKKIAIYKKNCNSKIDKVLEPLIKKIEKSKILFNYMNGKIFEEVFLNKISNYEFLKRNIFIPRKYEYTDKKLHEYNFKIWIKDVYITDNGQITKICITLGNKGIGFKESGFGIFLFINKNNYVKMKPFQENFIIEKITPKIINDNEDIKIESEAYTRINGRISDLFIGIAKKSGELINEICKLNNKNYEDEDIVWIS
ncbi:hypothetical protein [Fusobacterium periodonticum]|uniref:Uncharacterized protein n=1 Tax=Fusobacterium periodonticum ATCC 33693 TaxID=546275 RepID=D4CXR2_9FUSO|nr:hypothetical protein [Fusobacterium periodonticum]EFE85901.1 hypothetical protein FUSPEROL_02259 [Fusobacterium periodonticum ATCC 33693]